MSWSHLHGLHRLCLSYPSSSPYHTLSVHSLVARSTQIAHGGGYSSSSKSMYIIVEPVAKLVSSVPAGAFTLIITLVSIPGDFPRQGQGPEVAIERKSVKKLDFFGGFLLIASSVLTCCALEEAGIDFGWRSAFVIACLSLAGFLWIFFVIWEKYVSNENFEQEPVFSWRFLKSRNFVGMLL